MNEATNTACKFVAIGLVLAATAKMAANGLGVPFSDSYIICIMCGMITTATFEAYRKGQANSIATSESKTPNSTAESDLP